MEAGGARGVGLSLPVEGWQRKLAVPHDAHPASTSRTNVSYLRMPQSQACTADMHSAKLAHGAAGDGAGSSALCKEAWEHAAQELKALELASAEALAGLERLIERQHQEVGPVLCSSGRV